MKNFSFCNFLCCIIFSHTVLDLALDQHPFGFNAVNAENGKGDKCGHTQFSNMSYYPEYYTSFSVELNLDFRIFGQKPITFENYVQFCYYHRYQRGQDFHLSLRFLSINPFSTLCILEISGHTTESIFDPINVH